MLPSNSLEFYQTKCLFPYFLPPHRGYNTQLKVKVKARVKNIKALSSILINIFKYLNFMGIF